VESIATGLMAGANAAALASGISPTPPPRATAFGSLVHYITQADSKNFQPANITFDLLPALEARIRDRKERHRLQCKLALREFENWLQQTSFQSASRKG
jgi:methylenetetrahydrofolate--tRNA-(uracil-5-)-methyltransferase